MSTNLISYEKEDFKKPGLKKNIGENIPLTQFMAADEIDWPIKNERYKAFEKVSVSLFQKFDFITPNRLTYFRFATCFFLLFFSTQLSYFQILILGILGGLSDFFDGALARASSMKTRLGVLLDPLADKLLSFTIICILMARGAVSLKIVLLIFVMEVHIIVIPFFSWLHGICTGKNVDIRSILKIKENDNILLSTKPVLIGRVKFHLYMYGILLMMLGKAFDLPFFVNLANWFLIAGICAGAIAFCIYVVRWTIRPYSISLSMGNRRDINGQIRQHISSDL